MQILFASANNNHTNSLDVAYWDLTNIGDEERQSLISTLDMHGEPHVISESHFVISSDMQHDNAMVQKILDDFIVT